MRPLLVLCLVIVAVATLLVALFSLSGDDAPATPVAGGAVATPPTAPTREDPIDLRNVSPGPTPARATDSERQAVATNRESVEPERPSYDNTLVVRVVDPEGEPLSDVGLVARSGATPGGTNDLARLFGNRVDERVKRNGSTDEQGYEKFHNLEPGGYSITATHPDFSRKEEPFVMVTYEGETSITVQLQEGLVVHGYVRDEENGQPIRNAKLTFSTMYLGMLFTQTPTQRLSDEELQVETDETGYYRFLNVSPGQMNLTASAPGYGSETLRNKQINHNNGNLHTFDFRLGKGHTIAGRVFAPDRSPIVGATVELIGYQVPQTLKSSTVTDQRGRFSISDLVEGPYLLTVHAQGWGVERRQRIEAPNANVEVEMTEQGTIMGRVVSAPGDEAVPSYLVTLHQYIEQNGSIGRSIKEEKFESEDGAFTLKGVAEGMYVVKVSSEGYAASYSADFSVTQGLVTTDVVVRLSSGGSISGTVIDSATGKPVVRATVTTRDNEYRENAITRMFANAMPQNTTAKKVVTKEDGSFVLDFLTPDVYQIVITHPRYPEKVVTDVAVRDSEDTEVDRIALDTGSTVRGTVFDGAGNPLAAATVQMVATTDSAFHNLTGQTGPDGRYLIPNVPEGTYTVTAQRPQGEQGAFTVLMDVKNSQVILNVSSGREYTQDLSLGGGS